MNEWWHSMPADLQVFYGIALVSTAILFAQTAMMMIGGHGDLHVGDVDMSSADQHAAGLHMLSVRTVVAFAVGFGWAGVCVLHAGAPLIVAVPAALIVGGMLMLAVFRLMRAMAGLASSGTLDYQNAVGQTASVYIPIPANLGGNGQVEVMVQGRLMVVQACTRATQAIAGQTKVTVVALLDRTTLVVEPLVR